MLHMLPIYVTYDIMYLPIYVTYDIMYGMRQI